MDKSDLSIDVTEDHSSSKAQQVWADNLDQKITSLERIFLIINFIIEIPSAVFDQLSSVQRPQYALLNMLMSFAVMIISIVDLVYRGRKSSISWMKKGFIPWFYYPHPDSKPFGTFADIIGLFCGIFQWIFASIAYVSFSRHSDYPIKFSTWPIIFAFGLLYSKLSENALQRRSNLRTRKLNRPEEFTLAELAAATNDFSDDKRVGKGRLGIVYRGRLVDGREVAIKKMDVSHGEELKKKDSEYEAELVFLFRLHHRNLVGLVGYCEEGPERLLVFDFLKNGSLYTHLFFTDNSVIHTWPMRIKIALDAARGIDYLHNYAVPPIIHGAINSSNILFNDNWTAGVCDFSLAVHRESEQAYESRKATQLVDSCVEGYVDPEYDAKNILTTKSDVYSLGVVLLELLTGKRAIFNDGGKPTRLVDYVVPKILRNELAQVLDHRIGPPKPGNEAEAVDMAAYTALHCLHSEANNRSTTTNVVFSLEQTVSLLNENSAKQA